MPRLAPTLALLLLLGCGTATGTMGGGPPPVDDDDDSGPDDDDAVDDDDASDDDDSVYVPFDALPVLLIDVGGDEIVQEVKIDGRFELIEDHDGSFADLDDRPRAAEGLLGIEIRGRTSAGFPKKSYNIEFRDEFGQDLNVSLLGMPEEADFVLYGPYSDKTFLRNLLAYRLGAELGRWQPRTRLIEVFIDDQYLGVYLFTEKIKRGGDRVPIPRPAASEFGGDLTGGYIFKREGSGEADMGWTSAAGIVWDHHYPRDADITPDQAEYLHGWVDDWEAVMLGPDFADPDDGYLAWIDLESWVDFAIVQELTRNIDGYKKSSYYYKEPDADGGRLYAGPLWDFNISWGNVDYCDGWEPAGLVYQTNWCFGYPDNYPPWWETSMMEDPTFQVAVRCRWEAARQDALSLPHIHDIIDEQVALLEDAEPRDHLIWPVIGVYLWPNAFVGDSYEAEVDHLRSWIDARVAWLDANLPGTCSP